MTSRPRDDLGDALRKRLHCPMCSGALDSALAMLGGGAFGGDNDTKPLRVIAYRKTSVRLECRECSLRFSVDVRNFAHAVAERQRPPDDVVERAARKLAADDPTQYLHALAHCRQQADKFVVDQRRAILEPHRRGIAAGKPRRGRIRFPKRQTGT
jgi:hypothetical protein